MIADARKRCVYCGEPREQFHFPLQWDDVAQGWACPEPDRALCERRITKLRKAAR